MNLLYAQAGGTTAVINASAAGVVSAARARGCRVVAARYGILGVLAEALVDCDGIDVEALAATPGGLFGSCRLDMPAEESQPAFYDRIFDVLAAHDIGGLLYNGGNGSLEVVAMLSAAARRRGYPLVCVGIPKTIDNDIEGCDCCPGFGSAAKYLATSMREVCRDLASMTSRKGRVFVMEAMGRNVGWLAAATALAARDEDEAPHIVLFPEAPFDEIALLAKAEHVLTKLGYCAITVAEGIRHVDGSPVRARTHGLDPHLRFGGAGEEIALLVSGAFDCHRHYAAPDYLQRSAAHWVSAVDHEQALAVGGAAVEYALEGRDGMLAAIRRLDDAPYRWDIVPVDVARVAGLERRVPREFIAAEGMQVSEAGRRYLAPLVEGERPVRCVNGLPAHCGGELSGIARKLTPYAGFAADLVYARR
ncbi:MAG: diphosphate--fructose-6-phosphate 1-phosphotransferase [Azoarcus sp.]|jgi:6-phosphofructokinase 1|nr:diphosphate--fructose-6-phosphate 1-phosphotransferase [Azoarcus sp.]